MTVTAQAMFFVSGKEDTSMLADGDGGYVAMFTEIALLFSHNSQGSVVTPILLKTRVANPFLVTAAELKHFVMSLYDTPVVAVPQFAIGVFI